MVVITFGADVVEVTAKAQAHPVAHLHLLAPCLQALLWLADARWRKLGSAAPVDQVQHLLDCLQGHVALLWAAFPPTTTSHDSSEHLTRMHRCCLCLAGCLACAAESFVPDVLQG